jgi:hypothetical protein
MAKKMPPAGRPHRTPGASQPPRTPGVSESSGTMRQRAGVDTLRTVYGDAWSGSDNAEHTFPSDPQPKPRGGSGS